MFNKLESLNVISYVRQLQKLQKGELIHVEVFIMVTNHAVCSWFGGH